MHKQLKSRALELRIDKELSYSEIKKVLGVPKSTLSEWLKEFPLRKEKIVELQRDNLKRNEAKIENFRNAMRSKRDKEDSKTYKKYQNKFSKISEKELFAVGLALYLSEGSKKDYYSIALANTDPNLIRFFINWLEKFFDISKERIKISLHLYENMDIDKEKGFWKDKLNIKDFQIYKPWVSKLKEGSFTYRESFRHGTCTVRVHGGEKKRELMMAIRAFFDNCFK